MGITACTVPPRTERCPMGHICFHYTCNRLCRKQGRKQTQPPNGFIPVFPWALIKTKSTLQHTADAALYRVNTVFSPTFFRGGDWSPDWHILHIAVLGQVGHLLQSSAELKHFCVLPLHLLLPTARCSVSPTGLLATHKLPESRSRAHQLFWATERRKIINSKWVMNWSSGVWVLKRSRTEGVKGRKPPKVLKTIFPLPTSRGDDLFPNDQRSKHSSHTSVYELEETG